MTRKLTCSGEAIPLVKLSLEKATCLRSKGEKVRDATGAVALVTRLFGCEPQERFFGIFLSSAGEVLSVQQVSTGGLNQTQVDPRVLFAGAVTVGAAGILLVHNHPAGDPTPSAQDTGLTRQLIDGARLLGLRVLDHIIIARGGGHTSMRDQALVPFDDYPRP